MSTIQSDLQTTGQSSDTRMDVDLPGPPTPYTGRRRPHSEGRRASSLPAKRQRLIEPKVGYVYDDRMLMHACMAPDGHPEQPARLTRVHDALLTGDVLNKMKRLPIREVERDEVLLVHSETLWDKVMAIACREFRARTEGCC